MLVKQVETPTISRSVQIRLPYRPPLDWRAMLSYLQTRAIPGVEQLSADTYARTITLGGAAGVISVRFCHDSHSALLTMPASYIRKLYQIVERVRIMFDLMASSSEIESALSADPLLKECIARHPGIRVPVAWDGFEVGVRAILGQQVSVKGATTLVARLAQRCGSHYLATRPDNLTHIFPCAEQILATSLDGLGITTRRIAAIKALAAAVHAGELRFDGSMSTAQFVERSTQIPGIGPWTAQYIALRALNDPDAFPHADLILLRAAAQPGETLSARQLLERSQAWRPWRAYVVMLLWREYAQQKRQ